MGEWPINDGSKGRLEAAIQDRRWGFELLGRRIILEGLAIPAFGSVYRLAVTPRAHREARDPPVRGPRPRGAGPPAGRRAVRNDAFCFPGSQRRSRAHRAERSPRADAARPPYHRQLRSDLIKVSIFKAAPLRRSCFMQPSTPEDPMALQIHRRPVRRHPAYAVVWPLGSLAVERSRLIRAARHAPSASLAHQAEDLGAGGHAGKPLHAFEGVRSVGRSACFQGVVR